MIRLARFLKPYLAPLLAAIVLLFIQANAELALPDYMSRIVNIGIQQGGVESAVPAAIRASVLDRALLFLEGDDVARVREMFRLVEPGSAEAETLTGEYPILASEAIYVYDRHRGDDESDLSGRIAPALLISTGLGALSRDGRSADGDVRGEREPRGAGAESPTEDEPHDGVLLGDTAAPPQRAAGGPLAFIDEFAIPPGSNVDSAIAGIPPSARAAIATQVKEQFAAMGGAALTQAAATAVRLEYEAIGMDVAAVQTGYIVRTGAWMLLISLIGAAATILVGLLSAKIAAGFSRDVRRDLFTHVEGFSNSEFDTFSTASLITRTTNDVMQVQMVLVMLIRMVFFAPIIGVGGVIRALGKNSSMWWIIAAAVGVLSVLITVVYFLAMPRFKLMQKLMDRLNLVSREMLTGVMVVRAFNRQRYEERRFDEANTDLTNTTLFVNRVMVVMMPLMMLIMNGLSLLIIWVGAKEIAASTMQVGDMIAFIQYAMQIVSAFLMLSFMFIMLPRATVSADRIADVLETQPTIKDPPAPQSFPDPFVPEVEFRNVRFRYPAADEDALHDVSFRAAPGKTTAIIGATGSGKSTIANLIPRFYEVTSGEILVGGRDVRTVAQHDVRSVIGYVPQKATLFSGTISSNVSYANEGASEEDVRRAIGIAQADEIVAERDEGVAAPVAQGGGNLSGGQKQRLSIARALLKRPPMFIFDDAFSALDYRTDANLRRALAQQTAGATVLLVSQRVATIRGADRILVLDDGRIVGQGTHRELMESCETYREIALSQLTAEELA